MKNIITCTGYGGTGSSVVSDLFKEFNDTKSFGDFEFRFLFEPSGVRELEYGVIDNNDRLVSSYYIKKFIKSFKRLDNYEIYFNGNFKKNCEKYINEIITLEWDGCWSQDIIDANYLKKALYKIEMIFLRKILRIKEGGVVLYPKLFKEKIYYSSVNREQFIKKTKEFTDNLISNCDHEGCSNIVFDQLVPPANLDSYLDYFNNLKVVVVDRDPRDLYLLNKIEWKEKWIPSDNIDEFIKWFKEIRINRYKIENKQNVLLLSFEDFIYKYDETIDKVCDFCDVDKKDHIRKREFFKPDLSIRNTNLAKRYTSFHDDIKKIESELTEYCYCYQ